MTKTQQQKLEEPFPSEMLDTVPKEGRRLTYVPAGEVVQRLNDVLGSAGWSWETTKVWRDEEDSEWVLAVGNLTATVDGETSTKSGTGGVKVKLTRADKTIVDLGDEFKGAESDALKKAAQRFGVGLWLARTREAREYEAPTPVRDAASEGWESEQRWQEFSRDLQARIKASPEGVQKHMREFREKHCPIWPPSFDDWTMLNSELARTSTAHSQYEADPNSLPSPPPAPRSPDSPDPAPPVAQEPTPVERVAQAFPGSVQMATDEHVETIMGYMDKLDQGGRRAVKKYLKELGWPENYGELTKEQADKLLDFIENL